MSEATRVCYSDLLHQSIIHQMIYHKYILLLVSQLCKHGSEPITGFLTSSSVCHAHAFWLCLSVLQQTACRLDHFAFHARLHGNCFICNYVYVHQLKSSTNKYMVCCRCPNHDSSAIWYTLDFSITCCIKPPSFQRGQSLICSNHIIMIAFWHF